MPTESVQCARIPLELNRFVHNSLPASLSRRSQPLTANPLRPPVTLWRLPKSLGMQRQRGISIASIERNRIVRELRRCSFCTCQGTCCRRAGYIPSAVARTDEHVPDTPMGAKTSCTRMGLASACGRENPERRPPISRLTAPAFCLVITVQKILSRKFYESSANFRREF